MTDFSTIFNKIEVFKALIQKDSISPEYLGSLLEEMLDCIQGHCRLQGEIAISELDSISRTDALAAVQGSGPFRYNVLDNGKIVGTLDVISDESAHVYTQILTTHRSIDESGQLINAHEDTVAHVYYRSLGLTSPTIPRGQWTPWHPIGKCFQSTGDSAIYPMSQKAVTELAANVVLCLGFLTLTEKPANQGIYIRRDAEGDPVQIVTLNGTEMTTEYPEQGKVYICQGKGYIYNGIMLVPVGHHRMIFDGGTPATRTNFHLQLNGGTPATRATILKQINCGTPRTR